MAEVAVGAAQAYIEGAYGGPTTEKDTEVTATTTAQRIVGNDPERLALTLINLGANNVYAMYDDKVSATRGIIIFEGGGVLSLNVRDDQTLPTRQWYIMTTTGTSDVLAIETRRYALTGMP